MKKLSELLKEKRLESGLSLSDVEKATKIKKAYLVAIEEARYQDLPSESYAQGFVKNYAIFLKIPEYKIGPMFRREYESGQIEFVPKFRKEQHKFNKFSFLSARGILIIGAIMLVIGFIAYQYSSLFLSPQLEIESPKHGQVIAANVVQVSGKTDPYATVEVGGDEVYVGLDGKFKKSIYAFAGDKKILITAQNRFGKKTVKEITVRVR